MQVTDAAGRSCAARALYSIQTPAAVLDLARMKRNIEHMQQRVKTFGVRFRPHIELLRISEQDHTAGALRGGQHVGERHLPGLIDKYNVDFAVQLRTGTQKRSTADHGRTGVLKDVINVFVALEFRNPSW